MPIVPINAVLKPDEQVKVDAAIKQMKDLLEQVSKWVKYRLLTPQDRHSLIDNGFASDLVDNLVYLTQRYPVDNFQTKNDQLVTGFTEAAFDPSVYACESISSALKETTVGRCAWCESFIEHSGGVVSHYRPSYGYAKEGTLYRNAYYDLAYNQDNLLYTCKVCAEDNKADKFPVVKGEHLPLVTLQEEKPVLINPYVDDPRQYIRFNPLNGNAYPYDQVLRFYNDVHKIVEASEVDAHIWHDPANIPQQQDVNEKDISLATINDEFAKWKQAQTLNDIGNRGQQTIDILGLNRPSLVRSRINHLRHIRSLFLAQSSSNAAASSETSSAAELIKTFGAITPENDMLVPQYISLTIDAISTWSTIATSDKSQVKEQSQENAKSDSTLDDKKENWLDVYNQSLKSPINYSSRSIPSFIRSGLMYIVLENELGMKNKRRIVSLSVDDLLYGSITSNCVFLQINWDTDFSNTIKVHTKNHTWETSFTELANTRPVALKSLLANNEIWAEGAYEALVDM